MGLITMVLAPANLVIEEHVDNGVDHSAALGQDRGHNAGDGGNHALLAKAGYH